MLGFTNFGSSILATHINKVLNYSNPSVYEQNSCHKKCPQGEHSNKEN
jgi:hypothetical protein